MPAFLALIPLRYWLYLVAALAIISGAVALRAHYVSVGWDGALEAVKKQDGRAIDAADAAQKTADDCYAVNGTWSVVTGACAP